MKKCKTLLPLITLVVMCLVLGGCKGKKEDDTVVRIGALSGPTAMGMVKLMQDSEDAKTKNNYQFAELSTDPANFVAPLAKGEIDIAAVPSNLAGVIYNNTEGGVQILAVNTLGVLHLLSRDAQVKTIEDLAGKQIYATGEGATPEYTLRHILKQYGMDMDKDVTMKWCADTTEALSYISKDEAAIAMLPQPFATAAMGQVEGLKPVLDLNDAWDETGSIITGVVVARTQFVEEHPDVIETFLAEYEASIAFTNEQVEEAAQLVEHYGIVPKAQLAQAAIPKCHITFMKGAQMKEQVAAYLQILFDENPASVGGALPEDDFYYGN